MKRSNLSMLFCRAAAPLVCFLSVVHGAVETAAPAEEAFPPRVYDLGRYENLQAKSPFEFELKEPPPAEAPNPFEGMVLAGYVGSNKNMTVYLVNTKANGERISVYGDGSPRKKGDKSGIRIVGLNRGRTLKQTSVILEKDGQTGEVQFDDKALSNMKGGAPAAGAGQPNLPGNMRGPGMRPGGTPNLPNQQNQPGVNPAAQYQAPQAFVPGQPGGAQPNAAAGAGANGTMIVNGQAVPVNNNAAMVNFLSGQGAVPGGAAQVQQGVNVQPQVVQPAAVVPAPQAQPVQTQQPGGRENGPPKRRVVLPTN
jgi:hypothetical protein